MSSRLGHRGLCHRGRALLILSIVLGGCDEAPTVPEDSLPSHATSADPFAAPTAPSVGLAKGLDDYRRLAEGGDVDAMMVLGRGEESLGNRDAARQWFTKAAEKGNQSAKAALAALDSPNGAPRDASPSEYASSRPSPSNQHTTDSQYATSATLPTSKPTALKHVSTVPVGDPGKLRWEELLDSLDTTNFTTLADPSVRGKFVGMSTSPDKTIKILTQGPAGNNLQMVHVVLRVKSKIDPGSSERVLQAAAIAARVTRDNVSQPELIEWITKYLKTGEKSEPIFRNGWQITITGAAGQGFKDRMESLGTSVVVELKK